MANETLITDLVAREAIEQLVELDGKMDATLTKFKDCARELARGLKVPVEVNGDVDKLRQLYDVTMKDLAHATAEYTQQVQAQQRVVANTTNTISRQLAEQEKLNKVQREAFVQEQGALDIADRILGTREQNIRQLASYKKQLEQVKAERKAGMITDEEALSREMELKAAMQETQKVLKNETKMNQAASGSYQQLSLQLERLKQAQKQLNEEEKAGEEGQALEKEIQNLDAHLKDLAADMGEFQRNVGNYAVANGSLKSELRETTAQLAQMLADGVDPTSEEFLKLAERAGTLKDAMKDAKATINDYANDTRGLTNTLSVVQTGMSAWQAYVGVLNAFGVESSDAQKSMQKMMGIMTTLNALQKISTELTTNGTGAYRAYHAILKLLGVEQTKNVASTTAQTVATNAQTTATVSATTATVGLKTALAALGIGAVIALLGALYTAYSKWKTEAEASVETQKEFSKEMETASSTYGQNRAELARLVNGWKELKTTQEKNQFIKDNQKEFNNLGVEVKNVDQAEDLLVSHTDAFIEAMQLRAQAAAYAALAAKAYQDEIVAMDNARGAGSPTIEDRIYGAFNMQWGESYNESVARESRKRSNGYWDDAINAHNKAGEYVKSQGELLEKANNLSKRFGKPGSSTSSSNKSSGNGRSNKTDDPTKQIEAMIADSEKLILDWQERMAQVSINISRQIVDSNIEAYQENVKNVNFSYSTIETVINERGKAAVEAERKKYDELIEKAKAAGKDTTELEKAKGKALQTITDKYNEDAIANEKTRQETIDKMRKDYIALATKEIQDFYAGEQAMADVAMTEELTALKQKYAQGLITKEQYEEESAKITEQYAEETIKRQINSLKKQLSVANLTTKEREKLEQELAKAQADLANKKADAEIEAMNRVKAEEDKILAARRANTEKWVQTAGEALSKISDFASAMFDNRIAQIEQELEAEQQQYDTRVSHIDALAEQGAITTEEAELRKRDALAETQRKQEQLEKKKAELAYKQAIIEKANSVAQIGIATALGIMNAWTAPFPINTWLPGMVAAMGAIQVATALAQPIKAYKEGTQGKAHPGGLAIVGDGDKPEVVMFGGRAWITPDSPTLVDLPKGAQVLPDADALTLRRMGSTLVGNVPRNGHGSGPIIINDYDALESKMANNTKVLARGFSQLGADIKRELRRQSFREYIKRRT